MFCTKCGSPNDEDWEFCRECGAPLKKARPTTPPVNQPGPPKPPGPGKAIAVVLALLACVALVGFIVSQSCSTEPEPTPEPTPAPAPVPTPAPAPTSTPVSDEYVNGWWQSAGQSGSVYHHFVDGTDYVYQLNLEDKTTFTYSGSQSYTLERFEAGDLSFTDDSGVAVHMENGGTYILEDGSEGFLTCINMDGSGYSGSSSLARPTAGDIPEGLVELVAQVEGSGSSVASTPANPTSLDVSGDDYGEVATLTGTVVRENMTPADTGMIWGAAVFYLELPEPITITYNGPMGDPVTDTQSRIQVWADEANPTMGSEEAYYAEHPDEISSDFDQYVGRTITVRGYIINAGTAHYFGGGCFFRPEVVG